MASSSHSICNAGNEILYRNSGTYINSKSLLREKVHDKTFHQQRIALRIFVVAQKYTGIPELCGILDLMT